MLCYLFVVILQILFSGRFRLSLACDEISLIRLSLFFFGMSFQTNLINSFLDVFLRASGRKIELIKFPLRGINEKFHEFVPRHEALSMGFSHRKFSTFMKFNFTHVCFASPRESFSCCKSCRFIRASWK